MHVYARGYSNIKCVTFVSGVTLLPTGDLFGWVGVPEDFGEEMTFFSPDSLTLESKKRNEQTV